MNGLPLHALAVHSTVVLVPLAALLGVLFTVPRLRTWARWPLGLVAVGAAGSTWVSIQSGELLQEALPLESAVRDLVERHEELANQLQLMILGYAVVAVAAVLLVDRGRAYPRPNDSEVARNSPNTSSGSTFSGGTIRGSNALALVFSVLLVVGGLAVGVQTYRVGDAGAKAVWNPTGDTTFSTD